LTLKKTGSGRHLTRVILFEDVVRLFDAVGANYAGRDRSNPHEICDDVTDVVDTERTNKALDVGERLWDAQSVVRGATERQGVNGSSSIRTFYNALLQAENLTECRIGCLKNRGDC